MKKRLSLKDIELVWENGSVHAWVIVEGTRYDVAPKGCLTRKHARAAAMAWLKEYQKKEKEEVK